MTAPEIKVDLVAPPIPIRDFDWCAWRDGDEEEGPRGWGKSSAEAVANLIEIEQGGRLPWEPFEATYHPLTWPKK